MVVNALHGSGDKESNWGKRDKHFTYLCDANQEGALTEGTEEPH